MSDRRLASERVGLSEAVLDVSALPTEVFGHRNIAWWATVGFMVIEGTTLALCIASYLYLRSKSFVHWPPAETLLPHLGIPTINLVVLLVSCPVMFIAARAARVMDLGRVRPLMLVALLLTIVATVLRGFEFRALNVNYRDGVYGSMSWVTLGFHTTLLIVDLGEFIVLTAMLYRSRIEPKHFVDVDDAAAYQYFLSLSMVPVYLVLYWFPRWL